jgi:hypothetical protein
MHRNLGLKRQMLVKNLANTEALYHLIQSKLAEILFRNSLTHQHAIFQWNGNTIEVIGKSIKYN